MAIVQNPIIGRSRKSLANTTFTTYKGQNVIKSKALTVANPRTAGQVSQRNIFKEVVAFARPLLPLIKISFKEAATRMSEYNAFVSANVKATKAAGSIGAAVLTGTLQFAKGTIGKVVDGLAIAGAGDAVSVTWTNNSDGVTALDSDKLAFIILDADGVVLKAGITSYARSLGSANLGTVVGGWEAGYGMYCWFIRASEGKASDSALVAS